MSHATKNDTAGVNLNRGPALSSLNSCPRSSGAGLCPSDRAQKYLRPAAVKAGVIKEGEKVRFGFHNFRHALATALVKLRVDAKTVQGMLRDRVPDACFHANRQFYSRRNCNRIT